MKNIRLFLQFLRYIIPTIYFNFKFLPLRYAIKLPIWLYKPKFVSLKGSIEITINEDDIKTGIVKMGFPRVPIYPNGGIMIENNGKIYFEGKCTIGNNSYISVGKHGELFLGKDFEASAQIRIIAFNKIKFEERVLVGWDCMFLDTDFHELTTLEGKRNRAIGEIHIGSNNWFGNTCKIFKNVKTNPDTIIAATSILTKSCMHIPEKSLIGNEKEIKIIKSKVWRGEDDNVEYTI